MESRVQREVREVGQGVYGPSDSYRRGYKKITSVATTTIASSMAIYDFVTELDITAADYTLTLPPVAEAKGKIYSVVVLDADTKTLTVTDAGDDARWTDRELGDDHDYLVIFSNGKRWFEFCSQHDAS